MMKKTLILTAILALTTTTVLAADTTTKTDDVKCKAPCAGKMPPRGMHKPPMPDFEKRLNLTDAQKKKVEQQREKDKAKMEPIRKQIREKQKAKFEIIKKYEEQDADLIKLNNEIKVLKDKEHKIMEENRKAFESILTKDQKAELEKIKAEHNKKFPCGAKPGCPKGPQPVEK